MWANERSIETSVAPEAIWRAWADVERWPEWNADIDRIALRGPFEAGSYIAMKPYGEETVDLRIAEVAEGESFVDEADVGGTVIRTVHRIVAQDGGHVPRRLSTGSLRAGGGGDRDRGQLGLRRHACGARRVRRAMTPIEPSRSPGFLLWHATLRWRRQMVTALAPLELTHVQFVLLASTWWLNEHDRQPNQITLAAHAGTDVKMTSQVVRELERKGLIEREVDPADSRARRLRTSRRGAQLAPRAIAVVEAADADFFAPVATDDAIELLGRLAEGGTASAFAANPLRATDESQA